MSVPIADIRRLVAEAGELALGYRGKVSASVKADLSIVSEADAAVESFLRQSLTDLAPGYGYIGEETTESRPAAAGESRAWVVDALDGSRAFVAGMPLWMPAVCLMDGPRAIAGAAINPVTRELFWADEDGPAFCNDEPLQAKVPAGLGPNTFIFGPTNHHRTFAVDFPGRIYCLGAPIYQLCLLAKGGSRASSSIRRSTCGTWRSLRCCWRRPAACSSTLPVGPWTWGSSWGATRLPRRSTRAVRRWSTRYAGESCIGADQ